MAETAPGSGRPGMGPGKAQASRPWLAWIAWLGLLAILLVMGLLLLQACRLELPWLRAALGFSLGNCATATVTDDERLLVERQREETLRRDILESERSLAALPDCPAEAPCGVGREARADLYLLQDLSSSFDTFLPTLRAFVDDLVAARDEGRMGEEVHLGFGSFSDKPFQPYGDPDVDYVFKAHHALTADLEAIRAVVAELDVAYGGRAGEEAQYEAMIEALGGPDVGWRADARRFMIVITDAPPFLAGAWPEAPGPEDGEADGDPRNEDYPSLEVVSQALTRAGVTPIFLVSNERVLDDYQALVDLHGSGLVLELRPDSENLLDTIFEAVETACLEEE